MITHWNITQDFRNRYHILSATKPLDLHLIRLTQNQYTTEAPAKIIQTLKLVTGGIFQEPCPASIKIIIFQI